MSSYPTTPAYTHLDTWDSETRTHPALEFMKGYTRDIIDGHVFDKSDTPVAVHQTGRSQSQQAKGSLMPTKPGRR